MSDRRRFFAGLLAATFLAVASPAPAQIAADPLPSWNTGAAKARILDYVDRVTRSGPDFVAAEERVAVFDNDGTLWLEQPLYTQFLFVIDRIGEMVRSNPSLREKSTFRAMADKDMAAIAKLTDKDLMEAAFATQAGLSSEAYQVLVSDWLARSRHARFGAPYSSLVYQPQLELLALLRGAGFKTYIVSGGDVRFMRAFAQTAYGVPPEQVIGTSQKTTFEQREGRGVVVSEPALESLDDGPGKPANIDLHIGRTPVVAVGNSDGDLQMLQFSAGSRRPNLQIIVRHDDAAREYAYDRASKIGRLDKALNEGARQGWIIVSMKADWRVIFPGR